MKNLPFIFAVLMLITSCGSLRKNEVVRHEVYRDSLTIRNEVIIDTLKIKKDSFGGAVELELLKQIGELTFRGDRTTTKIYYKDGQVGFNTESDSLIQLLLTRINSIEKSKSAQLEQQTTGAIKKTPVLDRIIVLVALIVLGVVLFFILKSRK